MPTVKLPIDFNQATCPECGRVYLVQDSPTACPHCTFIRFADYANRIADMVGELEAKERTIRSLRGVITKLKKEVTRLQICVAGSIVQPELRTVDVTDVKNYVEFDTGEHVCFNCHYDKLNHGKCLGDVTGTICTMVANNSYKLKPELVPLLSQEQRRLIGEN